MKRVRVISLLLCVVMVFGMIPVMGASAAEEKLTVSQTKADLQKNGSVELTASCAAENTALAYQWQILVPGADLWVDISGENGASIKVTYAMVANLLSDGKATLRAKSEISGETVCTDEVTITVTEPVAAVSAAPATTFALKKAATRTNAAAQPVDLSALKAKVEEAKAALDAAEKVLTAANDAVTAAQTALNAAKAPAEETQTESVSTEGEQTESAPEEEAQTESTSTGKSVAELEADLTAAQTAQAEAQTKYNDLETAFTAAKSAYDLASPSSDDETQTTYNVVVNYLFENNEIAADPYTASLAAGSNFSATVTFPTVQGYLPYLNDVQQNSLELNFTAISEDQTYNVVYKPTNVNYTVIHYQQNLNDDNYTEVHRETKQGLTNSTVPEVAITYDGFYALLYDKPAIAADGSTVVEVYYDRYYYLMNFDLDGGYGTEPIYARFGTPIGDVGTPTKAGYSFGGWSEGGNAVTLPSQMPAANKTYKAIWTANDTAKVTVVFWGENADDEAYSYIKSTQIDVKPGTEFTYSEDGTLICALEVHTHDLNSCYNLTCTQEEHTHSESCYTCGQGSHTHSTSCYAGVGSESKAGIGAPSNPKNGYVVREAWSRDGKVIYINGTWYKYTGNTSTGNVAPTTCGKAEGTHTHTDSCLGCGKTEHTHSFENNWYTLTCTKTVHTHTSDCYMNGAGLGSSLWTFVRSDTVTVAADGSSVVNVYYDRTEKTLTFKYNYSYRYYQSTETITAKWGSNISDQYKKIAANAGSTFWSAESGGSGPYTNYFGVMPQTSATYYNRGATGDDGTMTYWGQDLNGQYSVKLFEVTGVGGYTVTDEDRYEFEGFTYHHGTSSGSSCRGAAFYYTRNSYALTFNDGYDDVKSEIVLYEAPLSTYSSYVPDVPSAYEPGSVTFGGWYLNPECTGAEYKLNEHTMPADNVLLYAKWVPVTHTVEFYLDQAALNASTKLSTHPDITVPHGSKAEPTPAEPTNGSYTFVGWFYLDNGVEKAFDFANMPVNKDLQVYSKWSSNVLKEYTIYYKIQDTDTEIAAPTTGSGLAGITKTFDAKGGADLYAAYQEGYFPVTKSHSMTLDINATAENNTNVYTFWYVQKEAVPYTVKYLNKETGAPVATEKTVSDNRKAVVTETFVTVPGMMPDAYQKRLVVSVDENGNPDTEKNVIIFYYTEDTTHAYYKITHYTENLAKDAQGNTTWTEYASSQAVGDIGTKYTADPMTIPGFTYDSTVPGTVASGKLTANGLELKLYYTRNSYPYQVRYLEQGTGNRLANPKYGTGKYGEVVSESAIDITNYEAVAPTSQTLNIRIEEGTEAKVNIITFYYKEKEVAINYQVVGPTGCGTVSQPSETLKVLSGTARGSTATASSDDYRFVGWYTDENCTIPVNPGWVDASNKLTPVKGEDAVWTATTYYAKFEYNYTELTISKTVNGTPYDENDVFIFDVTGTDGSNFSVTLKAGGSVTITKVKVGETYTVTERTGWSSRYDAVGGAKIEKTLKANKLENAFDFTNRVKTEKWLTASSTETNVFDPIKKG